MRWLAPVQALAGVIAVGDRGAIVGRGVSGLWQDEGARLCAGLRLLDLHRMIVSLLRPASWSARRVMGRPPAAPTVPPPARKATSLPNGARASTPRWTVRLRRRRGPGRRGRPRTAASRSPPRRLRTGGRSLLDRSRSWQSDVTGGSPLREIADFWRVDLFRVRGSGECASESGEACAGKCSHWLTGRKSPAALLRKCSRKTSPPRSAGARR